MAKLDPEIEVVGQACPLLVPLIEEHYYDKPETRMILRKYLRPLKDQHIDTLILGCTHYPILQKTFQQIMGKNVHVLPGGEIVAESLRDYLERHPEIETLLKKSSNGKVGSISFNTTDDPKRFQQFGSLFFGKDIGEVKKVVLV